MEPASPPNSACPNDVQRGAILNDFSSDVPKVADQTFSPPPSQQTEQNSIKHPPAFTDISNYNMRMTTSAMSDQLIADVAVQNDSAPDLVVESVPVPTTEAISPTDSKAAADVNGADLKQREATQCQSDVSAVERHPLENVPASVTPKTERIPDKLRGSSMLDDIVSVAPSHTLASRANVKRKAAPQDLRSGRRQQRRILSDNEEDEQPHIAESKPSTVRSAPTEQKKETSAKPLARTSATPSRKPSSSSSSSSSSGSSDNSSSSSGSGSTSDSSSSGSSSNEDFPSSHDSSKFAMVGGRRVHVQVKGHSKAKPKSRTGRPLNSAPVKKGSPVKSSSILPGRSALTNGKKNVKPRSSKDGGSTPGAAESADSESSEEEDGDTEGSGHVVTSRKSQRDAHGELIAQVLCRWWYVLPDWPPPDCDYASALAEQKLKLVSLEDWESADDVDEKGFTKVYGISHYEGVFRDPTGRAIDLRPRESKPCYSTLKNKSEIELYELLVEALKNQITALDNSPYRNTEEQTIARFRKDLTAELKRAEESVLKAKRRKTFLASRGTVS